jgi:hypothetical protein
MTYNYYCHWIQKIYHATTLRILYVSAVYQLDREWCPLRLGMATLVVTLLVVSVYHLVMTHNTSHTRIRSIKCSES